MPKPPMRGRSIGNRELAPVKLDAATAYPSMWDRCLSGTLIGDRIFCETIRPYEFFVLTVSTGSLDFVRRDTVSRANPTDAYLVNPVTNFSSRSLRFVLSLVRV